LPKAVNNIKSDIHLAHTLLRREGELRASKTVDDILIIFTRFDESLKMSKLPRYVVKSPDIMPRMRLCDGDLRPLMSGL